MVKIIPPPPIKIPPKIQQIPKPRNEPNQPPPQNRTAIHSTLNKAL